MWSPILVTRTSRFAHFGFTPGVWKCVAFSVSVRGRPSSDRWAILPALAKAARLVITSGLPSH